MACKPGKEILVVFLALGDGLERVIGELVVVAVIAERGGALGKVAEIGFVMTLRKERSERPGGPLAD